MSVAEKLTAVAENMPKVYEAGQQSEYDRFWDVALRNQTYMPYAFAGCCWKDDNFRPKYDIKPKGNITGLFRASGIINLKKCLEDAGVTIDLSQATNATAAFGYQTWFTTLPKLDFSAMTTLTQTFNDDTALVTIEEIKFGENAKFSNTFGNCTALTHMIVTGVIAQNGLDLHWSTLLDRESLLSILNVLQDKSSAGGTWAVTLGPENLAKLTDAEKAIATQKGWTLA